MTPENIQALDEEMDEAGVRHTTELYAGAQHGYTMSDTAAYNEAATERHFAFPGYGPRGVTDAGDELSARPTSG